MKIFVDYDTTLVNLIDPWVAWINKKYNVTISSNDINRWYFLGEVFGKEADDFWRKENHYIDKDILLPFKGAVTFFHQLQDEYGKENVKIISSTRDHHTKDKVAHMAHYFGIDSKSVKYTKEDDSIDCNDYQVILTSKDKYAYTQNAILIDDYPLHVLEHIYFNKAPGIVFDWENRFGWCKEHNYVIDDGIPNKHKPKFETVDDFYKSINKKLYGRSNNYDKLTKAIKELSYE